MRVIGGAFFALAIYIAAQAVYLLVLLAGPKLHLLASAGRPSPARPCPVWRSAKLGQALRSTIRYSRLKGG
jgi:hypothetical protein